MEQVLVKEKKFEGKYVALRSMNDSTPVADGADLAEVYAEAQRRGVASPLLLFIPVHGMVQIY